MLFNEKVQWNQTIESTSEGIYFVAIAISEDELACIDNAPLCKKAISNWINLVNNFSKHHVRWRDCFYGIIKTAAKQFLVSR